MASKANRFTAENAVLQLSSILEVGKDDSGVRNAAIEGICKQILSLSEDEFKNINSHLQRFVSQLTRSELNKLVLALSDAYLQQRQNLPRNDNTIDIDINGRRYPVWINTKRPLTAIEEMVLDWLGNKKYAIAQQVAMQVQVEIASQLEQEEEQRIQEIRANGGLIEKAKTTVSDSNFIPRPVTVKTFPFIGAIATFWGAKPYKPVIVNLLPEASRQNESRHDVLNFVLCKWQEKSNKNISIAPSLMLGTTSYRLNVGLHLIRYWFLWLIGGSLVAIATVITGVGAVTGVINNIPKAGITLTSKESEPDNGIFILPSANVRDLDSANLNQGKLVVKVADGTNDDYLWFHNQGTNSGEIGVDGSNITYGGESIGSLKRAKGTIEVSLNQKSTPEAAQALLRQLKYTNFLKQPVEKVRKILFSISDGLENGTSKLISKDINIIPENQAPGITVPQSKTVREGAGVAIGSVSINDPDSKNLTLALGVSNGVLSIKPDVPGGLTVKNISSNKAKSVNITGSVAQIKATLANPNGIIYQGDKDFSGDDSLIITAKDDGRIVNGAQTKGLKWSLGSLEAKASATQNVNITVTPLKPRPVITVPGGQTVKENAPHQISGVSIKDPNSSKLTVSLKVSNGIIYVKDKVAQGLTNKEISNNAKNSVTLSGTVAQISKTLADPKAITYKSGNDFYGEDTLNITATNDANKTSNSKIGIRVSHTNRPPEITESETATTQNSISISREEAENLVNRYLQAKQRMFAEPYDKELAATLLTGEAYTDKITSNKEGSLVSLQKNKAYFQYAKQNAKYLKQVEANDKYVLVDVHIYEDYSFTEPGKSPITKTNDQDYRVTLTKDNGAWKIALIKSVKQINDGE